MLSAVNILFSAQLKKIRLAKNKNRFYTYIKLTPDEEVKHEQKFNDSELVKNFSYQGKNYNLSDSSQTNEMALMHHSREN